MQPISNSGVGGNVLPQEYSGVGGKELPHATVAVINVIISVFMCFVSIVLLNRLRDFTKFYFLCQAKTLKKFEVIV